MPERCRVILCGFDPMLVRGYVKTGFRAIWWYLPKELYEEYNVQPGDKICGKLLAVYNYNGEKTHEPNLDVEWPTAQETGYAVVVPGSAIVKFQLTEFHFIEFEIQKIKKLKGYKEEKLSHADEAMSQEDIEAMEAIEEIRKVPVYEEIEVYPGEMKQRKWWPDDKMKLEFHLDFVPP